MRSKTPLPLYDDLPPKIKRPKPLRPDCNNARVVLKEKHRVKPGFPGEIRCPRNHAYEVPFIYFILELM